MSEVFNCKEDDTFPDEIHQAGLEGALQVDSVIGWITLSCDEYDGVMNGCDYRVKPDA